MDAEKFRPYGELVHRFTRTFVPKISTSVNGNSDAKPRINGESNGHGSVAEVERTFEIYKCDASTPGFASYVRSMECFILWFIDAATFVDTDDERWKFHVM